MPEGVDRIESLRHSLDTHMFIFTVCQAGAESALKKEFLRESPSFHFAYSRPGFLTFKYSPVMVLPSGKSIEPDFELKSIFARAYGLSIGKAKDPSEIFEHARKLQAEQLNDLPEGRARRMRLHLWERDAFAPGEEPKGFIPDFVRRENLTKLRKMPEFDSLFFQEEIAEPNDLVLDLIYLEADSWWIGYHRHTPQHSQFPGGKPEIALPPRAPSRAYLKLEEAILWSGITLKEDDIAVEIGSAPGGASFALLERGLRVIGIDPGEMSSEVLKFGSDRFVHIAKPAAMVERDELPDDVQWILLDMNVAPNISLNTVERIAPAFEESLLGVILTLKINEWKFADEIPKLLRRVEKLGMVRIRSGQLAANKQEICVVGLTRKGTLR
jgi:23S rRNA (cytidine2498-2'-O)-methyltransferase